MKKCVIYVRTANESINSVEEQESFLRKYANDNDIEVVKVFSDNGYSGRDFNRPSFTEMLNYINKEDVDCILVRDLTRITRNLFDISEFINYLRSKNIDIITSF